MALWSLRQATPPRHRWKLGLAGIVLVVFVWWMIVLIWNLPRSVLPSPYAVAAAFPRLFLGNDEVWHDAASFSENVKSVLYALSHNVLQHVVYSIWLNVMSYIEAIIITVPLGFVIGLFGPMRSLSERVLAAFRYLPITAFVGILVMWFGISHTAKIQFLTFGLAVYTLLATIQRVDEVEQIYVDMAKSCGATRWQRITTIFFPLVIARLSDDLRNLVPLTWTYIVIAEGFNLGQGGVGGLINNYSRMSRFDFVFALVLVISVVGFFQDKAWLSGDRKVLAWKYA